MRVGIAGFYGYGNCGDEAVLQAIIDEVGWENEFIVHTPLSFNFLSSYCSKIPQVSEVRPIDDGRTDYDVYLLGGGKVDWGFGWQKLFDIIAADIPVMAYAVGVRLEGKYGRFYPMFSEFINFFDAITVRDMQSERVLHDLYANPVLTMCPAINLKIEKVSCPENMIVVCPRYLDFNSEGKSDNSEEVDWIVEQVQNEKDNVLLIPFSPTDREGELRDLAVCKEIAQKLGGARIFNVDPYKPRQVKYIISKCKQVISGGRYHPLVWAAAHNIPFKTFPNTSGVVKEKLDGFLEMYNMYGAEKLKEMARLNKTVFEGVTNG